MAAPILTAEGVSKSYRIGALKLRNQTARETLTNWVRRPFRRASEAETLWALRDVSFTVDRGEVLGVIGPNGAGKSTLLKVLSRVTQATAGRIELRGRVASLLEVGIGFHPDLTGRENVYLNGTILGMRKREIDARFDEIVDFAEVEKFIDTPVKRYSSGMYVRLAFAVAAHLEPEILVVDEVLAVGDARFQKKCLGKLDSVARGGRTVLFVSHNLAAIAQLCGRGLLLEGGRVVASGPIHDVVSRYQTSQSSSASGQFDCSRRSGLGWARITGLRLVDESGQPASARPADRDLVFDVQLELADAAGASLRGLVLELTLYSAEGQPLFSVMNVDDSAAELPAVKRCHLEVRLPGPSLIPGRYYVNAFLGIPQLQHVDEIPEALSFEIVPPERPWRPYELHPSRGLVCRKALWQLRDDKIG